MATKQPSSFTELHGNSRRPGRFSLLFMEHGEYMLSDLSVVRFDVPEATGSWVQAVRTNGRLKVCTRGLVFEPAAGARAPIVRWPFRAMPKPGPRSVELQAGSAAALGVDPRSLFSFRSRTAVDLESGGRVGSHARRAGAARTTNGLAQP